MEQKFDHFLDIQLVALFSQGDEGNNERNLHFCLIQKLFLSSGVPEFVKDEGPWDGSKDEHVQEDVENEHSVIPGVFSNDWQLIVRIGVVGA